MEMRRTPLFPPPRDACGRRARHKGSGEVDTATINGGVVLRRVRWHLEGAGSIRPVDRVLGIECGLLSVGVCEHVCRLNQSSSSFAKTAENLAHLTPIRLSHEKVRQVVEAEGKHALREARAGRSALNWRATDCKVEDSDTRRVYMGCDGVKVAVVTDAEKRKRRATVVNKRASAPSKKKRRALGRARRGADQSFKEMRLATFYDESQTHRHVAVTRGDHREAGRMMRREADRLGLRDAEEKVAVVDGADWIRHRIFEHLPYLDGVGLDFYHLAENVHRARRAVYGEDAAEGHAWVASLLHTAKHEGYEALIESLSAWRKRWRGGKRKAADRLVQYVRSRWEMIAYPRFIQNGWQIGSGPTESMCKTTTMRLKGCGQRWDTDNAEALMALAAIEQSHAWDLYWANRYHDAA